MRFTRVFEGSGLCSLLFPPKQKYGTESVFAFLICKMFFWPNQQQWKLTLAISPVGPGGGEGGWMVWYCGHEAGIEPWLHEIFRGLSGIYPWNGKCTAIRTKPPLFVGCATLRIGILKNPGIIIPVWFRGADMFFAWTLPPSRVCGALNSPPKKFIQKIKAWFFLLKDGVLSSNWYMYCTYM